MYKILPILGRREMKVWHFLEQDWDIVMMPFFTSTLHKNTLLLKKCGRFPQILGIFSEYPLISPQKWTP